MPYGLNKNTQLTKLIAYESKYLLAQEVTNLHCVSIILDDAIDGEMGVNRAHFVQETLKRAARSVNGPSYNSFNPDIPSSRQ